MPRRCFSISFESVCGTGESLTFSKALGKNVLFKGGGEVAIRALSFAFTVWVARALGREQFGVMNFAYSFPLLFLVIVDFGLNPLVVREVARRPGETAGVFYNLLGVKLALGLVFLLAVGGALPWAARDSRMVWAGIGFMFFFFLNSITEFCNAVFQGRQAMHLEAVVMTFQKIALLLYGFLALGQGWGLGGVVWAYLAAGACGLAAAGGILHWGGFLSRPWSWDRAWIRQALRQALPLTLTTLFINLYFRIDMTLLANLRPSREVGWYGAAHKCIEVLILIPGVLIAASFPGFSRWFEEDREKFVRAARQLFRLLLLLGLPLAAGSFGVGESLMQGLFGAEYRPAGEALPWLCLALGFIFLNYLLSYLLIAGNRQSANAWIAGAAVAVSVSANLVFIPRWGFRGAALSAALTEAVLFLAYFWAVRRWIASLSFGPWLWRPAGAVLLMLAVERGLRFWPAWPVLGLSGLAYAAGIWLFRAVPPEDWRAVRTLLKGMRHD